MWSRTPHRQRAGRASHADDAVQGGRGKRAVSICIGALMVGGLISTPAPARELRSCPSVPLVQPFAQWMDAADYVLASDGGFEGGGTGWTLERGAAVVEGNEPFQVGGASDRLALSLPAESSATSAPQCTSREHRTIRFFARTDGPPLDSLRVEALIETLGRTTNAIRVGDVRAGATWAPIDALDAIVNRMAISQNDVMSVRWRFTPKGAGNWLIDDFYIDPFRSN